MSSASRVLLGRIGRAHGLRGEVAVESYTRDPRDIASYGPLSDDDGNKRLVLTIVGTRENSVIARIEGVTDRTAAEQLRGTALWIARSALPPPEPGAYYHVDLIGLMATLPDGAELGRVAAVENFGAGDLLAIAVPGDRESLLLPFAAPFVGDVNFELGRIEVDPGAEDEGSVNE